MKIDIVLNHKKYQPEIEGMQFPAEQYTISITRSDGRGISKMEALTVLQTSIAGIENGSQALCGIVGQT